MEYINNYTEVINKYFSKNYPDYIWDYYIINFKNESVNIYYHYYDGYISPFHMNCVEDTMVIDLKEIINKHIEDRNHA